MSDFAVWLRQFPLEPQFPDAFRRDKTTIMSDLLDQVLTHIWHRECIYLVGPSCCPICYGPRRTPGCALAWNENRATYQTVA